jgi:hypothetical protein
MSTNKSLVRSGVVGLRPPRAAEAARGHSVLDPKSHFIKTGRRKPAEKEKASMARSFENRHGLD